MYESDDENSALDGYGRVLMLLIEMIGDLIVFWV
jgi:hypothetical protein